MDQHCPTLFERIRTSPAWGPNVAELVGHDSIAVNCGRCGKRLIVRLEDIKDRRAIDCDACEKQRATGNGLPIKCSAQVPASVDGGKGDGLGSLDTHVLVDEAGNPLSPRLQRVLGAIPPRFLEQFPACDGLLVTEVL